MKLPDLWARVCVCVDVFDPDAFTYYECVKWEEFEESLVSGDLSVALDLDCRGLQFI